jgi:hypothetical protein
MLNTWKESGYITFENKVISPAAFCKPGAVMDVPHGGAADEGFIDKPPLEDRLYDSDKGMMDNPAAEDRGGNEPFFRIVNPELSEREGLVCFFPQVFDDREQAVFKTGIVRA